MLEQHRRFEVLDFSYHLLRVNRVANTDEVCDGVVCSIVLLGGLLLLLEHALLYLIVTSSVNGLLDFTLKLARLLTCQLPRFYLPR